jgi:uncharacterized protein involved in exopolysaccharide biosynthesis
MNEQAVKVEEITLKEIWQVVFKYKIFILFIVGLFAVSSVLIAKSLPNLYRSEVTLIASGESSSGLSSLAGSLGGLANLAGVSLGGSGGKDNALIATEMLKSRAFLADFVDKYGLLVPLIAAEGLNEDGSLLLNEKVYDVEAKKWIRTVVAPKPVTPSAEDIFKRFRQILSVTRDGKTGVVRITLEFYRADIAQKWLNLLIKEINLTIKEKDMQEANNSIQYLTNVVEVTTNSAMKQSFYQIIEEQMKTLLLTKVRDEYVFSTIDPATFPEEKSSPKRALICIVITIVGFVFALMVVLIRHYVLLGNKEKN